MKSVKNLEKKEFTVTNPFNGQNIPLNVAVGRVELPQEADMLESLQTALEEDTLTIKEEDLLAFEHDKILDFTLAEAFNLGKNTRTYCGVMVSKVKEIFKKHNYAKGIIRFSGAGELNFDNYYDLVELLSMLCFVKGGDIDGRIDHAHLVVYPKSNFFCYSEKLEADCKVDMTLDFKELEEELSIMREIGNLRRKKEALEKEVEEFMREKELV